MKNLLFLCACLWALATPLRAVAGPPDIIVVRIYEGNSITAFITRGAGKTEKVSFENGITDENMTLASEAYYKLLQRLYQEGYTLQSTFSPGTVGTITLLFIKAP